MVPVDWRPRQESNLYLALRRRSFYPLNYGGEDDDCTGHRVCQLRTASPVEVPRGLGGTRPKLRCIVVGSDPVTSLPLISAPVPDAGERAAPPASQGICLAADGFGVAFAAKVVLAELDFEIRTPGVTVLLGPTGTGKSTLLRSLAGVNELNPHYKWWGSADYRGRPLGPGNRPRLVQQHARLMNAPVLEALAAEVRLQRPMPPAEVREWAATLAEAYGLWELRGQLDTPTIELPPTLQRAVAILREAATQPELLMIDEPTFGLPDYEAFKLLELVGEVARRSAVLLVLHNQKHARSIGSDVMMLAGGRIQEAGRLDEFFTAPASPAARQFIATGSCALPAPDADPATLAEDVPPPPPLPTIAQLAAKAAPESAGPRGFTWIVPGRLAGTPKPGVVFEIDYDLQSLKRVGVTCLVTLTEQDLSQEALARNGLINVHLPIRDGEPPTASQMTMLLMRMELLMKQGHVLAVHCLAGIGRTGTVLACWLIREGLTAEEALKRVRRIDPKFVQTPGQEEFLLQYEDWILKKVA